MLIHSLYIDLGGGTVSRSPFQRELDLRSSSLPPLLGRKRSKRPATKGAYTLGVSRRFILRSQLQRTNRRHLSPFGRANLTTFII